MLHCQALWILLPHFFLCLNRRKKKIKDPINLEIPYSTGLLGEPLRKVEAHVARLHHPVTNCLRHVRHTQLSCDPVQQLTNRSRGKTRGARARAHGLQSRRASNCPRQKSGPNEDFLEPNGHARTRKRIGKLVLSSVCRPCRPAFLIGWEAGLACCHVSQQGWSQSLQWGSYVDLEHFFFIVLLKGSWELSSW